MGWTYFTKTKSRSKSDFKETIQLILLAENQKTKNKQDSQEKRLKIR